MEEGVDMKLVRISFIGTLMIGYSLSEIGFALYSVYIGTLQPCILDFDQ